MTDYLWMSQMAAQTYPLADLVTGLSTTSQLLPKYLLLDMRILIPGATGSVSGLNFYISRVQDLGSSLSVYIGYAGAGLVAVCSGIPKTLTMTLPALQHWFTLAAILNQSIPWTSRLTGSICIGSTNVYIEGTQLFQYAATKLNRNVVSIIGQMTYLLAIRVDDQDYDGIVLLQAGLGVNISVDKVDLVTVITFSVNQTYVTLVAQLLVVQQLQLSTQASPITSINGVLPDVNGNINIHGLDCVDVSTAGRGSIVIKNPCSKPCCLTSNMLSTTIALQALKLQQSILQSYFTNQANVINYMQANLSTLMNQR